MILKKLGSPILILFILTLFMVQSCKKEPLNSSTSVAKKQYASFVALAEQALAKNKYDSGFYYFNKAKLTCDVSKDKEKIVYLLLRMAAIQQVFGDYSGTEASATEALDYVTKETIPSMRMRFTIHSGSLSEDNLIIREPSEITSIP